MPWCVRDWPLLTRKLSTTGPEHSRRVRTRSDLSSALLVSAASPEIRGVECRMDHGDIGVSRLSDAELLTNTRGLIGRSNQVFAALLAHLGEVEARGLHRT